MQTVSLILQILGILLVGSAALSTFKGLSKLFPLGARTKWWWTKYLPICGFALMLIAFGEPMVAMLPGIILVAGSMAWLTYCEMKKSSKT